MSRALVVELSPTAGSVDCPRCGALSAVDRCWNCGARYAVRYRDRAVIAAEDDLSDHETWPPVKYGNGR